MPFYDKVGRSVPCGGIVAYSSLEAPFIDSHEEWDLSDGHKIIVHHFVAGEPGRPQIISYKKPINPSTPLSSNIPIVHPHAHLSGWQKGFMGADKSLKENSLEYYNAPGKPYNPFAVNASRMAMPKAGTVILKDHFNYNWDPQNDDSKWVYYDNEGGVYSWNGAMQEWIFTPYNERKDVIDNRNSNNGNIPRFHNATPRIKPINKLPNMIKAQGRGVSKPKPLLPANSGFVKASHINSDNGATPKPFTNKEEAINYQLQKNKIKLIKTPYQLGNNMMDKDALESHMEKVKMMEEMRSKSVIEQFNQMSKGEVTQSTESLGGISQKSSAMNLASGNPVRDIAESKADTELEDDDEWEDETDYEPIMDADGKPYPDLYMMGIGNLIPGTMYQVEDRLVIYAYSPEYYFDTRTCTFVDYEMEEFDDQIAVWSKLLGIEKHQEELLRENPSKVIEPQDRINLSEIKLMIQTYGLADGNIDDSLAVPDINAQINAHPEWMDNSYYNDSYDEDYFEDGYDDDDFLNDDFINDEDDREYDEEDELNGVEVYEVK